MSSITLTDEQTRGLKEIVRWFKDSDAENWAFHLGGYAGTGKTTMIQKIIDEATKKVICCAPTGKAASVLRKKLEGGEVMTCHKALYTPVEPVSEELEEMIHELANLKRLEKRTEEDDDKIRDLEESIKKEKKELIKQGISFQSKETDIKPNQLVVIDEASMVTQEMRDDFKSTGCKALFVGDPGQLPPVGDGGWFLKRKPDYILEQVHRQALDSPIIRLSMELRLSSPKISDYQSGDCIIINKSKATREQWISADQIITGRNASRHRINRWMRRQLGFSGQPWPMKGEKLICLKNETRDNHIYINGVQCTAASDTVIDFDGDWFLDILYEEGLRKDVQVYPFFFESTYDPSLDIEPFQYRRKMREFDWAYAITVHKSQGSEWPHVIIADDKMNINSQKDFRKRWLYTAVTRAKEKLTWIQD